MKYSENPLALETKPRDEQRSNSVCSCWALKTATTFLQEHVLKRVTSVGCRCLPQVQLSGGAVSFGHLFSMSPSAWTENRGWVFAQLISETERAEGEDLRCFQRGNSWQNGYAMSLAHEGGRMGPGN